MSKIDIDDLNYIHSHEELNPPFRKDNYNSKLGTLLLNLVQVWARGFYGLMLYLFTRKNGDKKYDFLFLAYTLNNERTLEPIQKKVTNSILWKSKIEIRKSWRFALFSFILVLYKCIVSKGYLKKAYISEFMEYSFIYGYYFSAKNTLKKLNPKVLVVANDHSPYPRSYFRIAKKMGIKTIYVQHASVSINFPPLEFDYAFLDGLESYEKYIYNGKKCSSKIFLSGSSRFDTITEKIKFSSNNKKSIGIAVNRVDKVDKLTELIIKIKKDLLLEIVIRPHPSMDLVFYENLAINNGCKFSNPIKENPFDFINNNSIFISGESSIHLDVIISGKLSLYYNFTNEKKLDWYGYLKNQLIVDISSAPIFYLKEYLEGNRVNNPKICQYYVANYATLFWGKSSELISKTITMEENLFWKKIENVYQIR